jgi:hypothetical protein
MLGKNKIRKSITLLTALAVWCVYSTIIFAATKDITGEITVTGQVTVNGQNAVSNSTIVSGSTIVTGSDSSAVVSLGKLGRVELSADSSLTLRFTEGNITGILSQGNTSSMGKLRVSNSSGVATTITTKDATVIADAGQANNFVVEVECSHTHVDTVSGLVTMRTGNNDKQVAAGTTAEAGNLQQTGCKPCMRPNSAPPVPVLGLGGGAIAAILIAAAAGVGAAIFFGSQNDTTLGGNVTVVSNTR